MKLTSSDGRRWAFLKRQDIYDIAEPEVVYLTRWRIVETPLFAVFLHAIRRPDTDRFLHDHPFPFVSVVLSGGYTEAFSRFMVDKPEEIRRLRRWHALSAHRMDARSAHAIVALDRTPTWTLLFVGRRRREWGYWTPNGWIAASAHHEAVAA